MSVAMLGAEFRRTTRMARSYWLEYAADLLLYMVGFLLLIAVFSAASESYGPKGYLSTLIGYTVWKICASTLEDIARIASDEARTGTLEQLFVSGVRPGLLFILRSLGILLNHTIRGLLLAFILAAILGLLQPVPWLAAVVFSLTVAGACGLGFSLVGLVLVYKRLGGSIHLLWQMLVFFTGALAPIQNPLLGAFSKLLPLTLGITCLREIIIDGGTAVDLWQNGLLPGLLINTAFYLLLGVILFTWGQRRARQLGVLAHY
jgi:ABC-2 type transport system permease protein